MSIGMRDPRISTVPEQCRLCLERGVGFPYLEAVGGTLARAPGGSNNRYLTIGVERHGLVVGL
jgi:hypothetical protein